MSQPLIENFKQSEFSNVDSLVEHCNRFEKRSKSRLTSIDLYARADGETVTQIVWKPTDFSSPFRPTLGRLTIREYDDLKAPPEIIASEKKAGRIIVHNGAAYINGNQTRLLVFRPNPN